MPTPKPTAAPVVTGDITFSGLSLTDAQNNEAVLIDAIADSAGVDKSRVSIAVAADLSAARRRLSDGVIVTYSIATDTTADADALVTTLSALTTEDAKAALTTAAAENGVAATFATVTVTVVIVDEREDAAGDDDDDEPATASTEILLVVGILLLLVGVGAGVFISRRRPAPDAPAVIQMATHVVVDDGRMAKADPESPAPPIVAAAEEVPAPVWT